MIGLSKVGMADLCGGEEGLVGGGNVTICVFSEFCILFLSERGSCGS